MEFALRELDCGVISCYALDWLSLAIKKGALVLKALSWKASYLSELLQRNSQSQQSQSWKIFGKSDRMVAGILDTLWNDAADAAEPAHWPVAGQGSSAAAAGNVCFQRICCFLTFEFCPWHKPG